MKRTFLDTADQATIQDWMNSECSSLSDRIHAFETANILTRITTAEAAIADRPTIYLSGVKKSNSRLYIHEVTVSGGNAVFHLTNDGLSTGTAIFPNGNVYLKSHQLQAIDTDSPHTFGTPVLSNGNKTMTIPVKKSTGLNVALVGLTLLGAPAAANGSVARLAVWGD